MWIERLEVSGIRNLEAASLSLSPGLNLFWGANGAGKTALLEAVHLLGRGRSFRSARIAPVIQHGAAAAIVRAALTDEHEGAGELAVSRSRSGAAELRVNGASERRLSRAARLLPLQLFLPDGADLVLGAPVARRRFFDWGVFHVKPRYLEQLQAYQRALRQRNALLQTRRGVSVGKALAEVAIWTERLAALAVPVHQDRLEYTATLGPVLAEMLDLLGARELSIELDYRPGWPADSDFEEALGASIGRDVKLSATQHGPHRADLRLMAGAGTAAETLSRGQAKLVASALRLAQVQITKRSTGRGSVLLIDDVGAELDRDHSHRFFGSLAGTGCQVLATSLEALSLEEFGAERSMFHVERGRIRAVATIHTGINGT